MTSVHEGDLVLGALGNLGTPIDCAGSNRLDLEGPQVLWLVASGAIDLFAVDAVQQGHWHHLGRLEAGSLLLGPVPGPQHTLVARPLRDCVVHRINLRELYQPANTETWSYDEYGNPSTCPRRRVRSSTPSPSVWAAASPSSSRRRWRANAPRRPPTTTSSGCKSPGSVQYGSMYGAEAAADLLMDPGVWQGMVDQQYRLLSTLDKWIEQLERTHETRTAAGIKAGEAVRAQADRTLLASIGKSSARRTTAADADASYAACKLVAEAVGIPLPSPPRAAARATVSTRSSASPSPPGSGCGPYGSTGAGGGTTSARWWAVGRCPGRRSRCCGGAAAMSPYTRLPAGRPRSRRRTRRSSSRAR